MDPPNSEHAVEKTVDDFPSWYHRITLPDGTVTPGWFPTADRRDEWYNLPQDMTGKRVLDIGAFDGFWSFLSLQRGAEYVLAIEDWSDRTKEYGDKRHYDWDTFDFCREKFGYSPQKCDRKNMSVYDIPDLLKGETWDIILFLGVLYHLRHPLLALDAIAEISHVGTELYIESQVCDQYSPYRIGNPQYEGRCVMEFYPTDQLANRNTNWWAPNAQCLVNMMRSAGFGDLTQSRLTNDPHHLSHCRCMAKGVYDGETLNDGEVLSVYHNKTTTPSGWPVGHVSI